MKLQQWITAYAKLKRWRSLNTLEIPVMEEEAIKEWKCDLSHTQNSATRRISVSMLCKVSPFYELKFFLLQTWLQYVNNNWRRS